MADDFRIKQGFTRHPKTIRLRRRCGADGVLSFIDLLDFCSRTDGRELGDLSGMDTEEIEIAANWDGQPGALVEALVSVGYIDGEPGTYLVHEFAEHNPHVAQKPARAAAAKKAAHARWLKERGVCPYGGQSDFCGPQCGAHAIRNADRIPTAMRIAQKGNAPLPTPPLPSDYTHRARENEDALEPADAEAWCRNSGWKMQGGQSDRLARIAPAMSELKSAHDTMTIERRMKKPNLEYGLDVIESARASPRRKGHALPGLTPVDQHNLGVLDAMYGGDDAATG